MNTYFNCHNHTHYSNIRLLDSINKPQDLINTAIELGLSGIAITDHECLSSHMEINSYAEKLRETNPNFTIGLGNEIYLIDKRGNRQKYYHFILIAKDLEGHKLLRKMSSTAWYNSYFDRSERVPLEKQELKDIIDHNKGHIIATTACLGGELSTLLLEKIKNNGLDANKTLLIENQINNFLTFCIDIFQDDFYIECAPAGSNEQIQVNKELLKIAKQYNIKIIPGTDSHYLKAEDRIIHKAYLNSKEGEREVDSFYEFAHLMSYDEALELLKKSFSVEEAKIILCNSLELKEKITFYSLKHKPVIRKTTVTNYPVGIRYENITQDQNVYLYQLLNSSDVQERYWVNECLIALKNKSLYNDLYLDRLNTEADVILYIGEKLQDCLFAYFNTFKHYIDLFWECGSIVGPGRGSATGFLSNYLLNLTQLDPIRWNLVYWRFLNKERAELPSLLMILGSCKKRTLTVA